jgi:hypothetical protein
MQCRLSAVCSLLLAILLAGLISCSDKKAAPDDWVVKVGEKVLTRTDLAEIIPDGLSAEDSAKVADTHINRWVKDNVVLMKAEYNLPANLMDFDKQLTDYRNSLVVYTYERELVKQKLDTVITDREIQTYYDENPRNFELRDYIIRANFVKLGKDAPKLAQFEKWMQSDDDAHYYDIENYCTQFAVSTFLDSERWLYFDELLKEMPVKVVDKEKFLKENKYLKLSEGDYLYIIKIIEYQLKDATSPLELVKSDIRNIIVNKRKKEFIGKMRQDLMDEALIDNEIQFNKK